MKRTISLLLALALLLGLGAVALAGPTGASEQEKTVYNGDGVKQNGMPTLAKAVLGEASGTKFASAMLGSGTVGSSGSVSVASSGDDPGPGPSMSSLSFRVDWSTNIFYLTFVYDLTESGKGRVSYVQPGGYPSNDLLHLMAPGTTNTDKEYRNYLSPSATSLTLTLYDGLDNPLASQTVVRQ